MDGRSVIAKRLKEARTRAGLSQRNLGIRAGIDEFVASARINQYEREKHTPTLETVERLAAVLDVPAAYFYSRDDLLAEILIAISQLPLADRRALLNQINKRKRSR